MKTGRTARILAIKHQVRERDGFKCAKCGLSQDDHLLRYKKRLDVHRIAPASEYTVEGCIAVCRACHGKLPKSHFGRGDNKPVVLLKADVHKKAKIVLATQNPPLFRSLAMYIESLIRGPIERDYERVMKKIRESE